MIRILIINNRSGSSSRYLGSYCLLGIILGIFLVSIFIVVIVMKI